jgi:hypothetical protein
MRTKIFVLIVVLVVISMSLMGLAIAAQRNEAQPKSTLNFKSTVIPRANAAAEKSDMQTAIENYNAKVAAEEQRKAEEAARAQQAQASGGGSGSGGSGSGGSNEESYASAGGGEEDAWSILAGLIAEYPILEGTSVTFGDAQGYEAIAYYRSGTIVISPSHTYPLSTLIYHEAMHILDWRQDNDIDNDDR